MVRAVAVPAPVKRAGPLERNTVFKQSVFAALAILIATVPANARSLFDTPGSIPRQTAATCTIPIASRGIIRATSRARHQKILWALRRRN